jgi:hypothetical protein
MLLELTQKACSRTPPGITGEYPIEGFDVPDEDLRQQMWLLGYW